MLVQGAFKTFGIDVPAPDTPHWVSVIFAALGVVLLVADRYLPETNLTQPPNPHDVELFKQFRELFDDDVMYFLRSHDFAGGFDDKYFQTLNRISAVWIGSRYSFDDAEIAEIWNEFFSKNRELTRLIAHHTTPAPGNSNWCHPHWIGNDWHSEETAALVTKMNDTATELAEIVDRIDAAARKKWISTPQL